MQGLGGGLVIIAIYIVIAEVYDDRLRPRIFAALSAAWVLPSLVGPVISGALTQHLTWRLVFLSIPPFIVLALLLILPALRSLAPTPEHRRPADPLADRSGRRRSGWRRCSTPVSNCTGCPWCPSPSAWCCCVGGLRRLLPPGTVRVQRGMPAVIAFRGMLAGAFFAVDSFVPLTLTTCTGTGRRLAGVPLMIGALGWSAGSWMPGPPQQTHRHRYSGSASPSSRWPHSA